jgi:NTE family protein
MAIQVGQRLGPYEILSAIGAGGMGEVYRARDTRLDRIIAIKVLPSHLAERAELRERFDREARTVASLNHPHICALFDIGHQDGTDYLVMEYLEGETLAERLKKGPLPLDQVLQYAIEISDALDKAHRKGITHRDLKPGNIMLTKSGTKLLDFGLAKLKKDTAPANVTLSKVPTEDAVTAQGTILGTLQYMAPEQLEGGEVDARTDIFAFGIVVYEIATGKKAVPSTTDLQGIEQLVKATHTGRGKSLMLIIGGDGGMYTAAAYVFSPEDFERIRAGGLTRSCSIHVSRELHYARNVGLALSGGGSRAIAFHLGCLRALHDQGVLDRLDVISAVSGGAVIAAMYAYLQVSFADFDKSVVALLGRGIQSDIVRKMANPVVAAQTAGTIALAGSAAAVSDAARITLNSMSSTFGLRSSKVVSRIKNIQPPFRRWSSATVALEAVLRDRLFGSIPITAPRRGDFEIVLNACELRSGSAFRFGSRESGCWRYGVVYRNALEVAHAVAASAAYPALLPALDEVIAFSDRNGGQRKRRVLLTDGGVYDNLGVTCLEPGTASEFGYNHFRPEYIICCDAGQGIFQDDSVPYLWGARMVRAFESVFRKAQNATQNRLHLLAAADQLKGFVLAYLGQIDNRVPCAPSDLVRREEVFEYPTDFRAMRAEDIDRLAKRGEQLTRALVAYYCPEL